MSFWSDLLLMGRRLFQLPPEPEPVPPADACAPDPRDYGFTAAVIGLGAKMAAADGVVSAAEVAMFGRVFQASPEDAPQVARVFNLARQTVRGYEAYARRIGKRYRNRPCLLEAVLDGLFLIASADGRVTPEELDYLEAVSEAFGFLPSTFARIRATHLGEGADDPYAVLGVAPDAAFPDIRSAYRRLMADNHPDRVVANGAPREHERAAHEKAAAITSAYARIRVERGQLAKAG